MNSDRNPPPAWPPPSSPTWPPPPPAYPGNQWNQPGQPLSYWPPPQWPAPQPRRKPNYAGFLLISLIAVILSTVAALKIVTGAATALNAPSTYVPTPQQTITATANGHPVVRDYTPVPSGGYGHTIGPGTAIVQASPDMSEGELCTIGFVGVLPDGRTFAITAGHCSAYENDSNPVLDEQTHEPIGQYRVWQDEGDSSGSVSSADTFGFAVIELAPGVRVSSAIQLGSITDIGSVQAGDQACKLGYTTGWTCGAVTDVNDRQIHFDIDAAPGDSGGPVVVQRADGSYVLVGIVIGAGDSEMVAQPIAALLDLIHAYYSSDADVYTRA
ncbi:MAG: S1 family peptidase [Nocardiaceae bacterium]|nr:S1 family peptidase [Nocardiaceae bacterium]